MEKKLLLFEAMYRRRDSKLVRSKISRPDWTFMGLVFQDHLIWREDAPDEMNWDDAGQYVQTLGIRKFPASRGRCQWWRNLEDSHQVEAFNQLMVKLGGEPLKAVPYWTDDYYSRDFRLYVDIINRQQSYNYPICRYAVRPFFDSRGL